MRRFAPITALPLLLAACGSGTVDVPAGPDLTGTWTGQMSTPVVSYRLTVKDARGSLSGTGRVVGAIDSTAVALEGRKVFRTVDFTLSAPNFVDMKYHGTANADADSIVGAVTGSGFGGQVLVLHPVR